MYHAETALVKLYVYCTLDRRQTEPSLRHFAYSACGSGRLQLGLLAPLARALAPECLVPAALQALPNKSGDPLSLPILEVKFFCTPLFCFGAPRVVQ